VNDTDKPVHKKLFHGLFELVGRNTLNIIIGTTYICFMCKLRTPKVGSKFESHVLYVIYTDTDIFTVRDIYTQVKMHTME
jgi:hypothetical protein